MSRDINDCVGGDSTDGFKQVHKGYDYNARNDERKVFLKFTFNL